MSSKKRNYMYDAMRGFCMFLIPLQHFLSKGALTCHGEIGGLIYVTIDMFVMQCFFFLSGMFSKNVEKGRDTMFRNILWPVILIYIPFVIGKYYAEGSGAAISFALRAKVPYALWFLVALFVYRFFQKYYIRIPHLFLWAFLLYIVSGAIEPMSTSSFAISRIVTFFVSFLLGYYLTMEDVEKVKCLRWWQMLLLFAFLMGISYAVVYIMPEPYSKAFMLKHSFKALGILWWQGMLARLYIFIISSLWIVLLINVFSNREGFWSWIGMNTMPIYIFHLPLVLVVRHFGLAFGLFSELENPFLYFEILLLVTIIVTSVLASKPAWKVYDLIFGGSYDLISKLRILQAAVEKRQ